MNRGYIKFWRKAQDSSSWNRGLLYQGLIINLLSRAAWKKGSYQGRDILPGQFGAVMSHLAESLGIPRSTLQRMVAHLETDGLLKVENMGNRFVIITIINWHIYQCSENGEWAADGQPVVNQRAADGQPSYKEEEEKKIEIQDSNLTSFDCLSSPDGDDTNPPCPDGQKAERQESLLPDGMPEDENAGTQENSSGDEPLQHKKQRHNGGPPPCPYEQIRDMYHEVFPEHPRVALLNNKRRGAVKARWGDAGVRLRELKRPDSAAERLAYFQRLFLRAARSDFLTGKKSFPNGDVYRVTFDKLMSPGGFIGVIEGKYDNQQEAYA